MYLCIYLYMLIQSAPLNLLTTRLVIFLKLRFSKRRTCTRYEASFVSKFFCYLFFFCLQWSVLLQFPSCVICVYSLTFIAVRNVYAYLFCCYLFITFDCSHWVVVKPIYVTLLSLIFICWCVDRTIVYSWVSCVDCKCRLAEFHFGAQVCLYPLLSHSWNSIPNPVCQHSLPIPILIPVPVCQHSLPIPILHLC